MTPLELTFIQSEQCNARNWRGGPISCRFTDRIAAIRQAERAKANQACLVTADAKPELSFENGLGFFDGMFDGVPSYRGKYRFSHHYPGWDRVAAFDGKGEGGEEYKCARAIDRLNELEYWVRNVSQHPNAFWLPVAGGKTYPDVVAKL